MAKSDRQFVSEIDMNRLTEIRAIGSEEFEALAGLTPEQRVYLKTIINLGTSGSHASDEIERLARAVYGVCFDENNLPKQVLFPLERAGYITTKRTIEGKGANPFMVTPTPKLSEILSPLLEQLEKQIMEELRPFLRRPLASIIEELGSDDHYVKGLALEAFAIKLMRLIDLKYKDTRLRGTATDGNEVDVIFESSRLVHFRWQVQCNNTPRVSLDDVAKEVGLTHLSKSNVIVIVSTGEIGADARRYANKVTQSSNLCIVMVDRVDIARIAASPASIVDVLNREAVHTMTLRPLSLDA
jgi:hypothetical protein